MYTVPKFKCTKGKKPVIKKEPQPLKEAERIDLFAEEEKLPAIKPAIKREAPQDLRDLEEIATTRIRVRKVVTFTRETKITEFFDPLDLSDSDDDTIIKIERD
jgi:hypothetical protein